MSGVGPFPLFPSNFIPPQESQHQQDLIELARVKRQQTDLLQANEILKEELQRAKGEAAAKSEELNRQAIRMNDFENLKSKYMSMRFEPFVFLLLVGFKFFRIFIC